MVALAFVIAFTIAIILVCIFQCVPVRDFWDSIAGVLSPELGGRCIKVQLYFLVSGYVFSSLFHTYTCSGFAGCHSESVVTNTPVSDCKSIANYADLESIVVASILSQILLY